MDGAYVQVVPDKGTTELLMEVRRGMDLPWVEPSELHCTVMWSTESIAGLGFSLEKGQKLVEPGRIYECTITQTEVWTDHKGRKILVAKLMGRDLIERNEFWRNKGLHSKWPIYSPHVTLTGPIELPEHKRHLAMYKEIIDSIIGGRKVYFSKETIESPNPLFNPAPTDAATAKAEMPKGGKSKKEKFPGVPNIPSLTLSLPVRRRKLEQEEEEAVKRHGFNTHSTIWPKPEKDKK